MIVVVLSWLRLTWQKLHAFYCKIYTSIIHYPLVPRDC